MFCSKCGKVLKDSAVICDACGETVKKGQPMYMSTGQLYNTGSPGYVYIEGMGYMQMGKRRTYTSTERLLVAIGAVIAMFMDFIPWFMQDYLFDTAYFHIFNLVSNLTDSSLFSYMDNSGVMQLLLFGSCLMILVNAVGNLVLFIEACTGGLSSGTLCTAGACGLLSVGAGVIGMMLLSNNLFFTSIQITPAPIVLGIVSLLFIIKSASVKK